MAIESVSGVSKKTVGQTEKGAGSHKMDSLIH